MTTRSQVWPGPTQKNLSLLSKSTVHSHLSDFTKAQSDSVTPLPSQTSANPHCPQNEIYMTEPCLSFWPHLLSPPTLDFTPQPYFWTHNILLKDSISSGPSAWNCLSSFHLCLERSWKISTHPADLQYHFLRKVPLSRRGCQHGGGLGSARTPLGQAGSGSVLFLREERGIDKDLPPGSEQRESSLHEPHLLCDCRREAQRLRALRGRAVRRRASFDYAQGAPHRPHRPGNAHGLCPPHPGQGRGGEQGQAQRQYQALTAQKKPTDFNLRLLRTLT